jgi:phospholipid N-methyltransferase
MKIKTVSIDADVAEVLGQSRIDGNTLYLPSTLARPLYVKTNKVLELIGFKWVSGKVKGHVGQGDSMQKLQEALSAGKVVDEKQTYQFYETPEKLASRMASLADIKPEHRVLEPSAGKGAIVREIIRICPQLEQIHICELNPAMRQEALAAGVSKGVLVGEDFLLQDATYDRYDRIVMNPPFNQDQAVRHVRHAYNLLNAGGRLVAIMDQGWMFGEVKARREFREWYQQMQDKGLASAPELLPSGTFKESGTGVGAVLVLILKPKAVEAAA